MKFKQLVENLIWTNLTLMVLGLLSFASFACREYVVGTVVTAMAVYYLAQLFFQLRQFRNDSSVVFPAVTKEELHSIFSQLQLEARKGESPKDEVGTEIEKISSHQVLASASHQFIHALGFVDSANGSGQGAPETFKGKLKPDNKVISVTNHFLLFRAKTDFAALGSDLLELEDELLQFGNEDKPILVISEFRAKNQNGKTLAQYLNLEGGVSFKDIICHGVFAGVDLISHVGTDPWKRQKEVIQFFAGLRERYKHILVWLPGEAYVHCKPIFDTLNSTTDFGPTFVTGERGQARPREKVAQGEP